MITSFDFKIKMKKQSVKNDIKQIFESNLYPHKEKTEIEAPQTLQDTIKGQTSTFNILKKQIGLKPLMHAFENFQ